MAFSILPRFQTFSLGVKQMRVVYTLGVVLLLGAVC